ELLRIEPGRTITKDFAYECVLRRLAPALLDGHIVSIRKQDAALHTVLEINFQDLLQHTLPQHGVFQREDHLHAAVEIARHPVGTAQVDFFAAAVGEVIDAAVLEKAPHDAAHTEAAAHAAPPGPQRAPAAHDQVNSHTRL